MSYSILTDTSANLSSGFLRENHITAIPFSYFVQGKEYTCLSTETFDGPGFYQRIRQGEVVTTSQIPPQRNWLPVSCKENLLTGKFIW